MPAAKRAPAPKEEKKVIPPISKEAWDQVNAAVKEYPDRWHSGVCAFQMFNRESGAYMGGRKADGECHGALTGARGDYVLVNATKPKWYATQPEFMKWVVNEAPFHHGIKNDLKEISKHAVVIDLADVGKGGALWTCKALRHYQEEPFKIETWNLLREGGLNGLQAFIGADILMMDGNPHWGNSHCSLFSYAPPDGIRDMYDNIRGLDCIENSQANRGGWGCYGMSYNTTRVPWGALKQKTVKKADGWGGFTELTVPSDPKEYIAQLKEIFEGDPKNVG